MLPRIPLEIIALILAFLRDEKDDLMKCSLVCKTWLPLARAYFFRVVLTPVNVDDFIELTTSWLAFVSSTLHDLAITRNWEPIQLTSFPVLSRVTCLIIHNMHYSFTPLRPILSALPSLTHLYIDDASFGPFPEFTAVAGAFPHLQVLSFSNVVWTDMTWEPWPVASSLPKTLQTLSIALCYQADVLDWLLSMQPIPLIPHLNLSESVSPASIPSLARYLAVLSHDLQSLRIGFSSFDAGGCAEEFFTQVDLRLNALGLRELWFDAFVGRWEVTQVSTAGPWIIDILDRFKEGEQRLEVINFGIEDTVECEIDWEKLDQLLADLDLVRVNFWVSSDAGDFGRVAKALKDKLTLSSTIVQIWPTSS